MKGRPAGYEGRYQEARRMVLAGVSPEVATSMNGIGLYPFRRRMEREDGVVPDDRRVPSDPTPAQIRQRAELIRRSWTPEQEEQRYVGRMSSRLRERMVGLRVWDGGLA